MFAKIVNHQGGNNYDITFTMIVGTKTNWSLIQYAIDSMYCVYERSYTYSPQF